MTSTETVATAPLPEHPAQRLLAGRAVLQVVSGLDGSDGVENDVVEVVSALLAAGARALVAGPPGPLVGELQARGAEWVPLATDRASFGRILDNARHLRRLVRLGRVALVHTRARAPAWSAWLATRGLGVPLVTTHSGPYAGRGAFSRFYNGIMARGDVVLVSSQFSAETLARRGGRLGDRLMVVPRGVDLDAFDPATVPPLRIAAERRGWDAEAEERIVLLPARLVPRKGQAVLIEAVKMLVEGGCGRLRLVLAGDAQPGDAYLRRLARRIETDGLAERITIAEAPERIAPALMAADVVVLPSTEPEAFARTALQALALGRPLVTTALGAQGEVVSVPPGPRTGWLVPPGDAAALAEAIRSALELSDSEREALGRRARQQADLRFSRRHEVAATIGAYVRALGGPGEAGARALESRPAMRGGC